MRFAVTSVVPLSLLMYVAYELPLFLTPAAVIIILLSCWSIGPACCPIAIEASPWFIKPAFLPIATAASP